MCSHLSRQEAIAWAAALVWNEWRTEQRSWDQEQHVKALNAAFEAASRAYQTGQTCRELENETRHYFDLTRMQFSLPF